MLYSDCPSFTRTDRVEFAANVLVFPWAAGAVGWSEDAVIRDVSATTAVCGLSARVGSWSSGVTGVVAGARCNTAFPGSPNGKLPRYGRRNRTLMNPNR